MKYETNVKEVIQRTHNIKSFRFGRPEGFDFQAGQFFFITLEIDGERKTKHFTISNSPTQKGYLEFTKKITNSTFSQRLNRLKGGEWAEISGPRGKFVLEDIRKICFLSGGIGITPIHSICQNCTDQNLDTDIILLYGNEEESDIVFRYDFDRMIEDNSNLKVVQILNKPPEDWRGYYGYITVDIIKKEVKDFRDRTFYVCGPPMMVDVMLGLLKELEVKKIKMEKFPGY
ncbi:MAG: ferredoxin--NADP reductase [Candidatus Scalinduaceae bacterium]